MIDVYTHSNSLITKEFWKALVRKIMRKYSGPQAVCDSLLRGLKDNNIQFTLNSRYSKNNIVIVLSGIMALREQIARKKAGEIKTLAAGPNLVVTPNDSGQILCNPLIDHVLVPSKWVRDFYAKATPDIAGKLIIWPAGVKDSLKSTHDNTILIYFKSDDETLLSDAVTVVSNLGYLSCTFIYGSFTHADYLTALKRASAVVYISPSESQGIALHEAWMCNVPTFVHFTGITQTPAFTWHDKLINAPYLTGDFGAFYTNNHSLTQLLSKVQSYKPRQKCKQTLSDSVTVRTLLDKMGI